MLMKSSSCKNTKGIIVLLLLLFSDILAHVRAVSFWNKYFKFSSRGGKRDASSYYQNSSSSNNSNNSERQSSSTPSMSKATFYEAYTAHLAASDYSESSASSSCSKLAAASSAGVLALEYLKQKGKSSSGGRRSANMKANLIESSSDRRLYSDLFDLSRKCSEECSRSVKGGKSSHQQVCDSIPRGGASIAAAEVLTEASAAVAHTPWNISLKGWKLIFQFFLTTLNILCWLIPLRSKSFSENKVVLSFANAFSGGVFLSLAFGHLIPECVHGFKGYNEALPYMVVLGGYLLIFFVEKVAFDAHGILHEMEENDFPSNDGLQNGNKAAVKAEESANGIDQYSPSGRSALILLGALAVHSILEMTALGLANTFGDCALLTFSIGIHQVS